MDAEFVTDNAIELMRSHGLYTVNSNGHLSPLTRWKLLQSRTDRLNLNAIEIASVPVLTDARLFWSKENRVWVCVYAAEFDSLRFTRLADFFEYETLALGEDEVRRLHCYDRAQVFNDFNDAIDHFVKTLIIHGSL